MATDNTQRITGFTAAADLSNHKHRIVAFTGTKQVNVPSAGARGDAVLYNDPASGEVADLAIGPIVKVEAGAVVAAGAYVTGQATTGKAITATTGQVIFGVALEAGANGRLISVARVPVGLAP